MATALEGVGRRTISELEYVGSLNISAVGHAARHEDGVAFCRKPLSLAGIGEPDAADWRGCAAHRPSTFGKDRS
jgi:hypothetical protein